MKRNKEPFILFIASFLVMLINIGGIDLYGFDEARNAYCAREMQLSEEWIVPTFNGELRTHKPPMHYWFMIVGYEIFGYGGFGARFFGSLFGALTILAVYLFSMKYFSRSVAIGAAGVLLSSIHFSAQMHQAVPDPYLVFFMTSGSLLLFHAHRSGHLLHHFLAYLSLGFAILCKGPIGLLLPGFGVFLYLLFSRSFRWPTILSFRPFIGVALAIAVSIPWFILVDSATESAFTEGFLVTNNLKRFTDSFEGHGGIFLLTWGYVLIGMLPFSLLIGHSSIKIWRLRQKLDPQLHYILCMFIAVVLFFSVSGTKLINYTVPCYPFMAIILAWYLDKQLSERKARSSLLFLLIAALIIGLVIMVSGYIALGERVEYEAFRPNVLWMTPIVLGPIVGLIFLRKQDYKKSIITLGVSHMLAGILFFAILAPKLDKLNPVRQLESRIDWSKDPEVISYKFFNPAFVSIWDRTIPNYYSEKELLKAIEKSDSPSTIVLLQERSLKDLSNEGAYEIVGKYPDLFEKQYSVILRYQ